MSAQRLPTGGQYQSAVQNPARCFTDPQLRDATTERTPLGLPKPISGNFASVFPMTAASGARYAVKCFTRDVPHQLERYAGISSRLSAMRPWWGTDFTFQPDGIHVAGGSYPILRMNWIDAVSLTRWVDGAHGRPDTLAELADRFADLLGELAAAGIAHGDLQHGNVLVGSGGELRLIDYDGMYFPGLDDLPPGEVGHPNYQPPRRSAEDYGPAMDRFSGPLICLSLRALAADPGLWDRFNPDHEEYLLLHQGDLADPTGSERLAELLAHREPAARELGTFVRDCVPLPLPAMPEPPVALEAAPRPASPPIGDAPTGAHTAERAGLPTWMAGRVAARAGDRPRAAAHAAPSGTPPGATWILRGIVLVALVAVGCLAVGPFVVRGGAVALLVCCAALAHTGYRRSPAVLRVRRLRRACATREAEATAAVDHVAVLEQHRDELDAHTKELTDRAERRRADAHADHHRRMAELGTRRTARDAELDELGTRKADEATLLLTQRQEEHVAAELSRMKLAPRDVDTLNTLDIVHLHAAGISTPADFVDVDYRPDGPLSRTPWFRLANGSEIQVRGITDVKAKNLLWWRNRHLVFARRSVPIRLTVDDTELLNARYADRERELRDRYPDADDARSRDALSDALRLIDTEQRDEQDGVDRRRTEAGRDLLAARGDLTDRERRRAEADARLATSTVPSFPTHLWRTLRG